MTVYVDDWRQQARLGRYPGLWSHLLAGPADDLAELHELAASIGMRREWFQDKPWPRAHYDVPEFRRRMAVEAGAVEISWREGGRMRLAAVAERMRLAEAAHNCPRCHTPRLNRCRAEDGERTLMQHPHPERLRLLERDLRDGRTSTRTLI